MEEHQQKLAEDKVSQVSDSEEDLEADEDGEAADDGDDVVV